MEKFRRLKDNIERGLEDIGNKDLSAGSVAQAETISHTLKCIATYEAMEEGKDRGYSEHYPHYPPMFRGGAYDDGGSYGPGPGRGSGANRDSMGRYASEYRGGSYDGRGSYENRGSYNGGESYDDGMNSSYRGR